MKKMGRHTTTEKNAGQKPENRERQLKSYSIYSSCYTCPLNVYIRVVCDNDFNALVISGNPTEDAIKEAAGKLFAEFSQLCGDSSASRHNTLLREIYMYRAQIVGYSICARLMLMDDLECAVKNLNELGFRCKMPENEKEIESLGERLSSKIKEKTIRMKKAQKDFESLKETKQGEKPTRRYFVDQLIEISKWLGFRVTDDITIAEYASYLNKMKEYVETIRLKMKQHA